MKLSAAVALSAQRLLFLGALLATPAAASAQRITAAGQPAQLDIRAAGERSIRVTLKPISAKEDFPLNPAVATRSYPAAALSLRGRREEALEHLQRSIALNPENRSQARQDPDLENIRSHEGFRAVIESSASMTRGPRRR